MRRVALSFLLVVLGCGGAAEAPQAPEPAPPPVSAAPSAAPASAPPKTKSTRLGNVGDYTVASYPPTGFERLTPAQRALAYHLARAAMAGDPLFTMQTSKQAWPVTQLVMSLLANKDKLEPETHAKLLAYRRLLFLNHGLHDSLTGQKTTPPFTRAELEAAVAAAKVPAPSADLYAALFDPKVAANLTNKSGKDPIVESAANHYEGVTAKDLEKFKDVFELNGRVVKEKGKLVEQPYRAGDGAKVPPGLGAEPLARVVRHLTAAMPLAPERQRASLGLLVKYFQTGDNAAFREHDIGWLKEVNPVDYILGFVETYSDVREKKGSFEAFVAIPDPERDPPLQQVARNAELFEKRMPWADAYKRTSFGVPAAAAVTVVAASGDAGPFTFLGVNLPNAQDLRQKYGSKNFVVLSVGDTRDEISGSKMIEEFAPQESRAEMLRCAKYIDFALTSFHEVTGHGSGKVRSDLKGDPAALLAPYYSTMEEGRAELVADWLTMDPKTVEMKLLPDAGCQRVVPNYVVTHALMRHRLVPRGDAVEEDHFRADLIELKVTMEKGFVKAEQRGGKTFLVVTDPAGWHRTNGELLAEHQRIKATADKAALKVLVEKYGTRLDTSWRDEVVRRVNALDLPRAIAMLPPLLKPVLDDKGKVIDATAAQTASLDQYIAAFEASWKD